MTVCLFNGCLKLRAFFRRVHFKTKPSGEQSGFDINDDNNLTSNLLLLLFNPSTEHLRHKRKVETDREDLTNMSYS